MALLHKQAKSIFRYVLALNGLMMLGSAGCGGGTTTDTTPPLIVAVSGGIFTTPSPMTPAGGTADIVVDITDPSGVDTSSVRADVTRAGTSIIGGPQSMTSFNSVESRWGYHLSLPANSNNFANDIYTVVIYARDLKGNAQSPPFIVGTITVPNH